MTTSKKTGVLYNLAKQAKRRMKNYNKGGLQQLSYARLAYSDKDQLLYKKVCRMLDEDRIIINPINELIDKRYYDSLSIESKLPGVHVHRYIYLNFTPSIHPTAFPLACTWWG
jgi:hypothetical protein